MKNNKKIITIFHSSKKVIDDFFPSTGLQTGDNISFIRKWYEVLLKDSNLSLGKKWYKLNNGGEFRKWYGNFIDLLLWENNGNQIKKHNSSVIRNEDKYFQKGITWNRIATDGLNMRYLPENFIFDQSGDSLFFAESNQELDKYILSFFNTKISYNIMKIIAPTLNLTADKKIKDIENKLKELISFDSDVLTSWDNAPDGKILKSDVTIAKNYLSRDELESLGRIVNAFLDLAEDRAKRNIPMTMEDWTTRLDKFLDADDREILKDSGKITKKIVDEKAISEFEKYRVVQDRLFMSDFDKLLLEMGNKK